MTNRILDAEIDRGDCPVSAPRTGHDVTQRVRNEAGIGAGSVAGERSSAAA